MNIHQQVRRPLVGVALSMVAGLYLQRSFNGSPLLFLGLSACVLSVISWRGTRSTSRMTYLACLLLAATYGAVETLHTPGRAALPVAEELFRQQEILGTVAGDPQVSKTDGTVTFLLSAEAVSFKEGWRPADAGLRVRIKSPHVPVAYGERWRLRGRYRGYNQIYGGAEGIVYTDGSDAVRVREAPWSVRGYCYKIRRLAAPVFSEGMSGVSERIGLLHALLLGYRSELPLDLYRIFARTGTLHIFAISGLHVGVMAAILIAALKLCGVSKPRWGLWLIPLLFFYVVSTGMKPSAFRAFTMASVYFAAPLLRRRPDTVSAIALAAMILLMLNPAQLGDVGFLLSFTVVSGIVMVHAFAVRRLSGFSRPGWAVPLAQLSGPRPLMAFLRAVGLLALTSAAAWLFSLPLTARFFNTVSPAALIGNLAIIPLTFMIVLTGCLTLLSAPFCGAAVVIFNHANSVFVGLLIQIIQQLGALPGAYSFVRAPSVGLLVLWYAGLVLVFCGPKGWRKPGVLMVLCAALLWVGVPSRSVAEIELWKEADSSITICAASDRRILVAAGDAYSLSRATRRLQREGVNQLQGLVLSGSRVDPVAVHSLCDTFSVQQLWMNPALQKSTPAQELIASDLSISFSNQPRWPVGDGTVGVDLDR